MDNTVTIETLMENLLDHDPTEPIIISLSPANVYRLVEDYKLRQDKDYTVIENLKESIESTSAVLESISALLNEQQEQYIELTGVTHRWLR